MAEMRLRLKNLPIKYLQNFELGDVSGLAPKKTIQLSSSLTHSVGRSFHQLSITHK